MKIPPKLLLLFIVIPLIEVFLFIKIGGALGLWPTLGIILVTAFFGAWLTRSQGVQAMERLQAAALRGNPPHEEIFDGIFILVAGVLLITPGFFTDIFGFILLAPPARTFIRKRVTTAIGASLAAQVQTGAPPEETGFEKGASKHRPRGKVVDAEIIDD